MAKCYQLVGVPGSGKSTWIDSQDCALTCARVSTDKWVEIYAKEVGKTYSEVFVDFMPTAVDLMAKEVVVAREMGRDIIWDQTSTTVKSRARKFNMLPDYEHIAVVFKTPEHKELMRRLMNRPGKEIPDHVIYSMIGSWEEPTVEEGFKEIWFAG
jgi:predicted kinase